MHMYDKCLRSDVNCKKKDDLSIFMYLIRGIAT